MKRLWIIAALAASVLAFTQFAPVQAASYGGSRFADVWGLVRSDPYVVLPHYRVTLGSFFDGIVNRLLVDSRRTLSDREDILPPFQKRVHPIGTCLAGTWRITEESPYSGYFQKGSEALIIARASTALGEERRGEARSFGLAGKLFPTTDRNHAAPLPTANFFLIENLAGTYTPHFLDAEQTSDILFIAPRPGALFRGPLGVVALQAFAAADETFDLTRPFVRQLYPIAELGEPAGAPRRAPRYLKVVGSATTPRVDELDYRHELDMDHYEDGIHFDIYVADHGLRGGPKDWQYLGDIHFTESVASDSCDHRLHFAHPPWRDDAEQP
jgi:hypothetical protein